MKKLLLSTLLLLSGVAHAAKTIESELGVALDAADSAKVTELLQINPTWKNKKLTETTEENGNTTTKTYSQLAWVVESNSKALKDKNDKKIEMIELLILRGYKVTTEDLKICFKPEHKAFLVALTKQVAVAKDEELVITILKSDLDLSVKKELFANLKEMNKELLQQEYVIETLLCLSTNDETNDEVDAWIHELVNEGATVSDTAKSLIEAKIENPQKTGEKIDNPRVDLLKKDVDIAATSIVNGEAKTVLGISAGFIIALVIWKKYKKEIKAFFGDEEIEEALSKK